MDISETRSTQALALGLSAELSEVAERLAAVATKAHVNGAELFDFVFECVNEVRERLNSEFTEKIETCYERTDASVA